VARVDFYHLTRDPVDRVLPAIAARILSDGDRLLIVAGEGSLRAQIDEQLWVHRPASFLPHGMADAEDAADEVILIAREVGEAAPNGARLIALADGVWRAEALAYDRAFYLFDNSRIDDARAAWRALADKADIERLYWKQEGGKWRQGP
jgi:DNA polymerase-3 subunit chi